MDYINAKGWLTQPERECLVNLAKQSPNDGVIVNVGIEFGASLVCLREGNAKAMIIGIDIDITKVTDEASNCCDIVVADSGAVVDGWAVDYQMPIDLAFIDGDHAYAGVMHDCWFANYVNIGGYIAFHDCYSWEYPGEPHKICPDVNRAVTDWFTNYGHNEWQELAPVDSMRIFRRLS